MNEMPCREIDGLGLSAVSTSVFFLLLVFCSIRGPFIVYVVVLFPVSDNTNMSEEHCSKQRPYHTECEATPHRCLVCVFLRGIGCICSRFVDDDTNRVRFFRQD